MESPPPPPKSGDTTDLMPPPSVQEQPSHANNTLGIGFVLLWFMALMWIGMKLTKQRKETQDDKQDKS